LGVQSFSPISTVERSRHFAASLATTTRLSMIGNLWGNTNNNSNNNTSKLPSLPRDVKDAVAQCRKATQRALQDQQSRMDVTFPVGTKFGVEKAVTSKKQQKGQSSSDTKKAPPTRDDLDRSDRELARLHVEMFQPVGGDRIAVLFTTYALAEAARQQWKGDATAQARILCMDKNSRRRSKNNSISSESNTATTSASTGMGSSGNSKKKNPRSSKAQGFAAKLAAEVDDAYDTSGPFTLPDNIEVALCVAPGPKELITIERICNQVGKGTLVILLNARLDAIANFGTTSMHELYTHEFTPVFTLIAASQTDAPNCLLYRAYPDAWVLARKPAVGQPQPIWSGPIRPSPAEQATAYASVELSPLDKSVEGVLENVANWFK
jgi:hypothetical protein